MDRSLLHRALTLYGQGQFSAAADLCRRHLEAEPASAEAALLLGESLLALERPREALEALEPVLARHPHDAQLEAALGEAHLALGHLQAAIAHLRHALQRQPSATAWYQLGRARERQGQRREACAAWTQALALDAEHLPSLEALGRCYLEEGDATGAELCYRRALAQAPDNLALRNGLALALEAQGRFEAALTCLWPLRHLADREPRLANNLGLLHQHLGLLQAARGWYRLALDRAPEAREIEWNLALCLLQSGDFDEGWRRFEARWDLPGFREQRRRFPTPPWDGRPLDGETLLLHAEQGLGDTLQFVRLAPHAAARGARVVLECQPSLAPLLTGLDGIEAVVPRGAPLPPHRHHCPLMGLPRALGLTLEQLPAAPIPYLHADPARRARWQQRLPARDGRPRVGVVWAGNPRRHDPVTRRIDRRRSLPLEHLLPLLERDDVCWISLQRDEAAARAQSLLGRLGVHAVGPHLADFADTAAVVAELDLVIAVDTAIVHLAGAMGRPVWVLSRFDACWRWLHGREDSPWYPTLRLLRQPRPGDWNALLRRVARDLDAFTAHPATPA